MSDTPGNWPRLGSLPVHQFVITVCGFLLALTAAPVIRNLWLQKAMPSGYEFWVGSLIAGLGVGGGMAYSKLTTNIPYVEAKAKGKPSVITGGPTTVTTETPTTGP